MSLTDELRKKSDEFNSRYNVNKDNETIIKNALDQCKKASANGRYSTFFDLPTKDEEKISQILFELCSAPNNLNCELFNYSFGISIKISW